ncbi:MAG: hypothetical protein K5762_04340 [Bacilli bacterium]|nr:hypothetical protein [Bacilli bacterium]
MEMEREKKVLPLPLIFKIATTILCVVAGFLLIWALGDIYFAGKEEGLSNVYSYESVAKRGGLIITALSFFVLSLIASLVLHFVFKDKEKKRTKREIFDQYDFLKSKKDLSLLENEELALYKQNERYLLIVNIICMVLSLGLLVFPVAYVVNPNNFDAHGDLLEQAISLGIHVLPFLFGIYVVLVVSYLIKEYFMKKSMEVLKRLKMKKKDEEVSQDDSKEKLVINIIRGVIALTAITFIIVGAINGEVGEVLNKAINICTECIGLG